MQKRTLTTVATALLATAGLAVAAGQTGSAPHHEHGKPHPSHTHAHRDGLPRGFDQLNLSAEQKAKIQAIMQQNRPEQTRSQAQRRDDFHQKMAQYRAQEQQLMSSTTFDEQAARALITERQQERAAKEREHAERELQMLKQRHAVFQILTPEQQQKYLTNQQQHHQRGVRHHQPMPR